MGDTLFGRERSGTPIETRGPVNQMGSLIQEWLRGGGQGTPLGRMETESIAGLLGFDPAGIGLQRAVAGSLTDPRDATAGLFAALDPFESRTRERASADLKESMGAMGNRFSSNLLNANVDLQGRLGETFSRTRQDALLRADANRNNAMASILQSIGQAGGTSADMYNNMMTNIFRFLTPGDMVWQEGIMGDILGAAGTAAGMRG